MIKRLFSLILTPILIFASFCFPVSAENLALSAESAILIDGNTKEILFEKCPDKKMAMASTTKIMTALVVIEKLPLSHCFTVNEKAVGTEGSSAYLQKGDSLTVEAALYALLLQSANDVANALAYEISCSIESFADLMNKKAKELSLCNTSFQNPSGLSDEEHYTTARDLALLSAACLDNEDFLRIVSTKSATVKINGKERTFVNHNKLLSLYKGAVGIKTGFTKESGRCLAGAAEKDGIRLISVTLRASDDWSDHKKLFDYGFSLYCEYSLYSKGQLLFEIPVAGEGTCIQVSPQGKKTVFLPKGTTVSVKIEAPHMIFAPIKKGQTVGAAVFYADGREIHRTPLSAQSKVD